MRWANQLETSLLTHHVYVKPSSNVTIISTSNNMLSSANLTLSYNVSYILRVESNICGQHNVTANIELCYGEYLRMYNMHFFLFLNCPPPPPPPRHSFAPLFLYLSSLSAPHPIPLFLYIVVNCGDPLNGGMENSSLVVSSYKAPALKGSGVNFTCANGLVLIGPNAATCMSNGEWEPDPREVECKSKIMSHACIQVYKMYRFNTVNCNPPPPPTSGYILPYNSTLEGANITYVLRDGAHITATCNRNGNWELNFSDIMCTQTPGM